MLQRWDGNYPFQIYTSNTYEMLENIHYGDVIDIYVSSPILPEQNGGGRGKRIDTIEKSNYRFILGWEYYAVDNLNIRNGEGVAFDRIGRIPQYEDVYIVEIGKEETIDGITSNWVSIKNMWSTEPDGWVFGGYLRLIDRENPPYLFN